MKRLLFSFAVGAALWGISQSLILAACTAIALVAVQIEIEHRRRARQHELVKRNWAEVVDSLSSAASAGLSPTEAFSDLAQIGPKELRPVFVETVDTLDRGASLSEALGQLKEKLSDANSDRTLELMNITHELGAANYLETLKAFGAITRAQLALDGELAAKQGWIKGTAKLAVASPWIIVLLLAARPENAAIYNSPAGLLVLATGLVVCLFAYRLIHAIGSSSVSPRVFAA